MSIIISIIICTYNRKDLIANALQALTEVDFDPSSYEIVLVDDGSSDGTSEIVQSMAFPCGITYHYQENSGLASARNAGIRLAQGEIILIMDDDTFADRRLLTEHYASHKESSSNVVLGWVNHIKELSDAKLPPKFKMSDISTSFFWTSNVSVRKEWLLRAGLFDEDFKEYGWEDLELGARLRKLKLQRRVNPRAIVYHLKKDWYAADLPKKYLQAAASARSAFVYLRKTPGLRPRLATNIHPAFIAVNDFLQLGKKLFQYMVRTAGEKPLTGITSLAAQLLVSFHYFAEIKKQLARQRGQK